MDVASCLRRSRSVRGGVGASPRARCSRPRRRCRRAPAAARVVCPVGSRSRWRPFGRSPRPLREAGRTVRERRPCRLRGGPASVASGPLNVTAAMSISSGWLADDVVELVADGAEGVGELAGDGGSRAFELGRGEVDDAPRESVGRRPVCAVLRPALRCRRSDRRRRLAERRCESRRQLELVGDPAADRIVAAGEVPGVVGVEALDAGSRAADAARRPRAGVVVGHERVALGRVAAVGVVDERRRRSPPRRRGRRRPPRAG